MRGFWLSAVVGASAASVSPVEKVIQLLETLQSKVVAEGSAEAKTYDSFACFCKDQSKAKTKAIEENETLIDSLSAEMDEQRGIRKTKDGEIVDLQKELSGYSSEVKAAKAAAKTRKQQYAVEIQDVTGAIKALEGAIDVLKSSDKTGMRTSLLSMKKTLRTVGVLAQAMGMGSTMLMQAADIPDVPTSDYDFHSNDILATLDELLGEFRKTAQRVDEEEVTAKTATTAELQSLSDSIAATEKSLRDAEAAKSAAEEAIGQLSGDFSIATATRNDDQNYLKDLTDKCNKKSDLWDQRTKMRQDELSALTGALVELKGSVTDNNSRTIRLDQEAVEFVQTSRKTVRAHHAVRMLNAVQKHSHVARRGFMQTRDPRDQVIEMLRSKAEELKAPMLAALATQVGDNPRFKKITQLIEDMILKLQNEAAEEETHNGFCVKQTKLAEEKRDMKAATITKLNNRLAKSEAKRDKLTEQIATLEEEIAELEDSLAKQTKIRGEEKEENASVISDAEAGRGAVEKAIEILDRFYKTAANKTEGKTFIQVAQGPTADDIPDGGFDAEYGASQDDSVGILGMLDVIQSDFVRTETETAATEKEQAAAFLEFSTTTKASLAEKNNAKQNYNDELTNTKESINKDTDDMASNQSAFDASIAELVELHAACVDTGMSYEERVQRREDEVAALKDAYSMLDSYSPA